MSVQIKQTNPNALKKVLARYKDDYAIAVGFPSSKTKSIEYPTGESVVEVAAANQFGVASKHIPARPFMTLAKKPAEKKIKAPLRRMVHMLNKGATTKKKMAEALGPIVAAVFKKEIVDLKVPPNAPATIRAKKSANPLVGKVGLLVGSLTYEVRRMKKGESK